MVPECPVCQPQILVHPPAARAGLARGLPALRQHHPIHPRYVGELARLRLAVQVNRRGGPAGGPVDVLLPLQSPDVGVARRTPMLSAGAHLRILQGKLGFIGAADQHRIILHSGSFLVILCHSSCLARNQTYRDSMPEYATYFDAMRFSLSPRVPHASASLPPAATL